VDVVFFFRVCVLRFIYHREDGRLLHLLYFPTVAHQYFKQNIRGGRDNTVKITDRRNNVVRRIDTYIHEDDVNRFLNSAL